MPRDRRPNKTPSNAAIVEASKLQTINAFEEKKLWIYWKVTTLRDTSIIIQEQLSVSFIYKKYLP